MGNHYHLLLKTPEGNLQRAMRHVGGLYTTSLYTSTFAHHRLASLQR
jgi:hypothetical protein